MDRRQALAIFRAVTAIVVIAAIAYQVILNLDSGLFRPLRFFAFFTILSNGFAAILWLWLAATWRRERTRTEDLLRGAATLYLVVTLIRGALDSWYPYPFLDPDHGGYGSVGYHVLAIFAGFLVIAGIIVALGDFGRDRRIRIARSRPVVDG